MIDDYQISIVEHEKPKSVYSKKQIKSIIKFLLKKENVNLQASITIVVLGSRLMKEINRSFRNKNKDANSLSFPLANRGNFIVYGQKNFLGDIIINIDRIASAKEFKKELLRNLIHSFLHLVSYGHENDKKEEKMKKREKELLEELNETI